MTNGNGQSGVRRAIRVGAEADDLLRRAAYEAMERGLYDFPIVDVDCHVNEATFLDKIAPYIDHPSVRRFIERFGNVRSDKNFLGGPGRLGDRTVNGRIVRSEPARTDGGHPSLASLKHAMQMMAIDYSILFPTPMLNMGLHPQPEVEVALGRGFNRYICDHYLAVDPHVKSLMYLPFNDPEACLDFIEEFADKPGVVGFMVTSVRDVPVHHNRYMPVYAAIQETGKPLAFHPGPNWLAGPVKHFNRFLSVHALTFPLYLMIHMTNLVINGIPERFPRLKFLFIEAGVAWLPFMLYRLDNEYMMRPSEAPQLKRKPSEYIKEFYFASQPIEITDKPEYLEMFFEMINAETQLLYASDYPHWDFDLPSTIYDLPFLSEEAKRRILGQNAMELFGLPEPELQRPPAWLLEESKQGTSPGQG